MSPAAVIRRCAPEDAPAVHAIYAPIVAETAISFELEPPTVDELRQKIAEKTLHPWLACELDGELAGYAYGGPFRVRPAYRWSVEVSVAVAPAYRRRNVASAIYAALLEAMTLQRFHLAVAVIALPNDASVTLHEREGFRPCGVLHEVGFKHGGWRDVGMWERPLLATDTPEEPLPFAAVYGSGEWEAIAARAVARLR